MKRFLSVFLSLVLFSGMTVVAQAAGDRFELSQSWDQSILAGGILDMYAWVGEHPEDYTFQWQTDVSMGDGHWMDLEDNANPYGYRGTDTNHLEFISPLGNGNIEGTGWEKIPFCCKVTHKKTGKVQYTANMFMYIYTSDDLDAYMAKRGIELYTPSAGTGTPTTRDEKTYYTTAEAGQRLEFMCGSAKPENDPLMSRSELRTDLEIWVTENGKTTKLPGTTYYPYTIGKDTVTVEFKLHYKIGVTDLGYYQTKTLKISVNEPAVAGIGTARQEMSLLKEPYGQSQKLATIPKGATIHVYQNSGSWWQVGYNGFAGYVAGSSVNYQNGSNIIDHVEINIAEPSAGNVWPSSNTVKPDTCFATSVEWFDLTTNQFMKSGERFVKGHSYRLVMWVAAKEGYEFKRDSNNRILTTAVLNNNLPCFTSQAYEQVYGKVIEITYDFNNVQEAITSHTCTPVAVEAVEPTCTQDGCKAHYRCSCGKTYADAAGTQQVSLGVWGILPATGHTPSDWRTTQVYHYTVCTTCGDMLDQEDHYGGAATCVDKARCAVCGYAYGRTEPDHKWSPTFLYQDASGHAWICADCKAHSEIFPHNPGPEATEKAPQICKDCGYILVPAKNHTHDLQKVPGVEATCTQEGNIEYYVCTGCMDCFTDPQAKNKIPDSQSVIIDPPGHMVSDIWGNDGEYHWRFCQVCNEILPETQMLHDTIDGLCNTCGYDSSVHRDSEPEETEPQEQVPGETDTQNSPPAQSHKTRNGSMKLWVLIVGLIAVGAGIGGGILIVQLTKKKE